MVYGMADHYFIVSALRSHGKPAYSCFLTLFRWHFLRGDGMSVSGEPVASTGWRGRLRISESLDEARALRGEVVVWRDRWDTIDAMGGHLTQLDLLSTVVLGLVDEIARRIDAIDPAIGTGSVYEECRNSDLRLLHARRLWRWYADKLDQRAGPPGDTVVPTLLSADEVVWSCWKTAFTTLGGTLPAAPIPYLAPQFSASATPRTSPPPDLRPGLDDLLRRHIEQLPVAVIGLPPVCSRRPWWIILSAHEASHHVQFELLGLEDLTQEQVVAAAYGVGDDVELAEAWRPWCRELFADTCSVLLTGPAAIWAVGELEMRTPSGLRKSASEGYPPPLVRLSVLQTLAAQAGIPAGGWAFPGQAETGSAADDERLQGLLTAVPAVTSALLGLTASAGRPLRSLAGPTADAYRDGRIAGWRAELLGADEPFPVRTLEAARFCASAGVEAWELFDGTDEAFGERLSGRMLRVLPQCREPGTRAATAVPAAADVTRRITADLYQRSTLEMAAT